VNVFIHCCIYLLALSLGLIVLQDVERCRTFLEKLVRIFINDNFETDVNNFIFIDDISVKIGGLLHFFTC